MSRKPSASVRIRLRIHEDIKVSDELMRKTVMHLDTENLQTIADLRYKIIRKLSLDTFETNQIDRMILEVEDFALFPSEVIRDNDLVTMRLNVKNGIVCKPIDELKSLSKKRKDILNGVQEQLIVPKKRSPSDKKSSNYKKESSATTNISAQKFFPTETPERQLVISSYSKSANGHLNSVEGNRSNNNETNSPIDLLAPQLTIPSVNRHVFFPSEHDSSALIDIDGSDTNSKHKSNNLLALNNDSNISPICIPTNAFTLQNKRKYEVLASTFANFHPATDSSGQTNRNDESMSIKISNTSQVSNVNQLQVNDIVAYKEITLSPDTRQPAISQSYSYARIIEIFLSQKSFKAVLMNYHEVKKGGIETNIFSKSDFSFISPKIDTLLMWRDLCEVKLLFSPISRTICTSPNVKQSPVDLALTKDIVALLDSKRKSISHTEKS